MRIAHDLGIEPKAALPVIRSAIERLSQHLGHPIGVTSSDTVTLRLPTMFNALALAPITPIA